MVGIRGIIEEKRGDEWKQLFFTWKLMSEPPVYQVEMVYLALSILSHIHT